MARLVNANPRIDVQTLVQMQKLGIPITVENASQFENYMNDSHDFLGGLLGIPADTEPVQAAQKPQQYERKGQRCV